MKTTFMIVASLLLCVLHVQQAIANCKFAMEKRGCYVDFKGEIILERREFHQDFELFLPTFACQCGEEVKSQNKRSGEEMYTGFALQTDYGYNWVCRGTKKDELAALKHGGNCVMKSTTDLCEDADDVCIGVGKDSTFAFHFKADSGLTTCDRNYTRVGCYDKRNPKVEDLLIFDRYNIKWDQIRDYMHHLACKCRAAAVLANTLAGGEKYTGFALHYYGECYGRTQEDLDKYSLQEQSKRCTGDEEYNGCTEEHKECLGHEYSEFVYKL
ncbi:uncharacterized protein LOC135682753 [Rhopilema esculentum]|uniref:uncharacterized protein LOC135682753 n=1 Tax=Rhopilema esculentum TaxID=499914 RepID=UPI0031CF0305